MTPYHPETWEVELRRAGLQDEFPKLVTGLRNGFSVDIRQITSTYTPSNDISIHTHQSHFQSIVSKEQALGCYVSPFSRTTLQSLIGPFQSSPLSIIPKPHKPNAFRLIQNFSFPRVPKSNIVSINHTIDSDNFPCTWGTFTAFSLLIWSLPEGSEGAVRDVVEAYRTIPLHPSQWPGTVVQVDDDAFMADTALAFGLTPSGGAFGYLMDAARNIYRFYGIGPAVKWVDDHVFLCILREHLAKYNRVREA